MTREDCCPFYLSLSPSIITSLHNYAVKSQDRVVLANLEMKYYIYLYIQGRTTPYRSMLFLQASFTTFMATILAFFLFLFFLLWILRKAQITARKTALPPEAGGAWPLIGHLHQLGGTKPTHITLGNRADKYGSIFSIRLGVHRTLIVSGWEIVKEWYYGGW
jgi:hypothetical protein